MRHSTEILFGEKMVQLCNNNQNKQIRILTVMVVSSLSIMFLKFPQWCLHFFSVFFQKLLKIILILNVIFFLLNLIMAPVEANFTYKFMCFILVI